MSSTANRLKYLDAIGVQVWEERAPPTPQVVENFNRPMDAQDLFQLQALTNACERCESSQSRKNVVFGHGSTQADWLIVGEFPSEQDDRQAAPFTQTRGQLLDAMLSSLDIKRTDVYLTNSVKCYSSGAADEAAALIACRQYLLRQIELVQPKVVLLLGDKAAQSLLNSNKEIIELRGKSHAVENVSAPIVVSHSLDYLLLTGLAKKQAWDDLKLANSVF